MANLDVQNENPVTITVTEVTPQLVVPPTKAMEAVEFYKQTFGAELTRYNKLAKLSAGGGGYVEFVCAEVKLGSSTFIITDYDDRVKAGAPPIFPPAKVCLRLECADVKASMEKARRKGCQIVEEIREDRCRPCMQVVKIKDRYGHFWQLSSSAAGAVSDGGFTDKESLNVLLAESGPKQRRISSLSFEGFPGTPKVGSFELKFDDEDAFNHFKNQDSNFNPVVLDLEGKGGKAKIVEKFRNELNFEGTIAGLSRGDPPVAAYRNFMNAGGDIMHHRPLDYNKVGHILVQTLRKEKEKEMAEAERKRKEEEEARIREALEKRRKEEEEARIREEAMIRETLEKMRKEEEEARSREALEKRKRKRKEEEEAKEALEKRKEEALEKRKEEALEKVDIWAQQMIKEDEERKKKKE